MAGAGPLAADVGERCPSSGNRISAWLCATQTATGEADKDYDDDGKDRAARALEFPGEIEISTLVNNGGGDA